MKVLTAAQMRQVDRRTIEMGIPGLVLMENAGHRVVELLAEKFAPLAERRIAILCGKGNNGGDGMVVARQLFTRFHPRALHVILLAAPDELKGDAAQNHRMLEVCGCPVAREIPAEARLATIVVDALLGTGISGPATGAMLEAIREINSGFPLAQVVAVDIPSGMPSDTGQPLGEQARADYTVTFTAPKPGQVLAPNCDALGELRVAAIGSPPELYDADDSIWLSLVEPAMFRHLLAPRSRVANKGSFGHVLVIAGSRGKTGAAAMSGMAALRSGAGLVTVASAESAIPVIAGHAAELMTEPLEDGRLEAIAAKKDVIAIGPGLGTHPETVAMVRRVFAEFPQPMVADADGLNALAGTGWSGGGKLRVLTPHPGEMARLCGKQIAEISADRIAAARDLATARQVRVVLKGERTLIAFPDGRVWINPTG
ncbi:MAG: NAD(P)H-hydrate dehydratase, partial [Bryobacteraceae bacterium]